MLAVSVRRLHFIVFKRVHKKGLNYDYEFIPFQKHFKQYVRAIFFIRMVAYV